MTSLAAGRRSLQVLVRLPHFDVSLVAERLDAVPPVQSHPNLLVRVHESLQLCVKFDVLAGQNVAVVLESVNFLAHVNI